MRARSSSTPPMAKWSSTRDVEEATRPVNAGGFLGDGRKNDRCGGPAVVEWGRVGHAKRGAKCLQSLEGRHAGIGAIFAYLQG